ncbi:hypothetical protein DSO57_1039315 [Entomophthora muscae]|uniref:Uncharacterized protein n=1 Tax=Entomophthora muscae TaxID=34485 RepID=A0ACC2RPC8_9FUNG|nr:hypothetical protein DSO57_1039315 [Entomophthora muscae]
MRLISNLKFLDGPDVASPPSTNSRGKRSGKASAGPKVGNLLSGTRDPSRISKDDAGSSNLTDFGTPPSDHTNLIGRDQPGELEKLDSSVLFRAPRNFGSVECPL